MAAAPIVTLAAVALTVALAGCGGSSAASHHGQPGHTSTVRVQHPLRRVVAPTPRQIARAARLTAAQPGYRAHVRAAIALASLQGNSLTAVGSGYFDPRSQSATLHLMVTLPGLLGLAGALPTRLVAAGSEVYFKVPAEFSQAHSGLPQWLETSLAGLDLSTLDPRVILAQVARDATRHVANQRAQVTIDPASGLIKTVALTYYDAHAKAHVHVTLHLTGFGLQPSSPAPPAAAVGQLSAVLHELGL